MLRICLETIERLKWKHSSSTSFWVLKSTERLNKDENKIKDDKAVFVLRYYVCVLK